MYPNINVRDASDWFYRRQNMQEQVLYPEESTEGSSGSDSVGA